MYNKAQLSFLNEQLDEKFPHLCDVYFPHSKLPETMPGYSKDEIFHAWSFCWELSVHLLFSDLDNLNHPINWPDGQMPTSARALQQL